jgi:tetratricopeptide (TPR) repeat protein
MALLEKYVEKHPQDGMTYKLLADLHFHQGDVEKAIQLYERASSLDPENAEAHAALGNLYAERLNYDKAAQHYAKATSLRPEEPYYKSHLAYAYNRLERHDEAITIGQKLTQEYENDPIATLVLGCVYFNAGEYGNAIEKFNWMLQNAKSFRASKDDLNKFLAVAYLKAGKPEAMNLTPWTLEELLDDCAEEGDYDGMLQMAIVGIRNQQDAWKPMWVREWLIRPLFEAGRLDELVDVFKRELENDPDNALIYKTLGYSYETMARGHGKGDSHPEKWLEAEVMLQKALDLTADSELRVGIYHHLGTVYRIQKRYDKAIAIYQEILKLKPKDIDAHQHLAHIYERTGQYEKAISIYQQLIELDKRSVDAYKKSIERCLGETSR